MRVRWTTDAADDLERICDYIAETNSDAARRMARTIVDAIASVVKASVLDENTTVQGGTA